MVTVKCSIPAVRASSARRASPSLSPPSSRTVGRGEHYVRMEGRETYRFATKTMANSALKAIERAGWTPADVDLFIPHQANIRIIEGAAKRLHYPMEKVFVNIQNYGNTSAASIPIALSEAAASGRLRRGDKVLLVAFGGGFTWGASVLEWFGEHEAGRPKSIIDRAQRRVEDLVDRVRPI